MGNVNGSTPDFHWQYTEQPHASRRVDILRKHPQIRKLMKTNDDYTQAWIGVALGFAQICLGYATMQVAMPFKYTINFTIGGLIAAYHFILMHEAAHGLIFGPAHPRWNKAFGIFINIFLGIPMFSFFKKHHQIHHKYQGDKDLDIEYPSDLERRIFSNHAILKLFFVVWAPLLQLVRAAVIGMKPTNRDEVLNHVVIWGVDGVLIYFGYFYMVGHWIDSFFLAGGIGIIGVWSVAVHTVLFEKEDTVSYYGWLNKLYMNLGYHMEHHDFPNIPSRLLPEVRRLAPEFYKDQHGLDNMYAALMQFLCDPRHGLQDRIKRDTPDKSWQQKWDEHNNIRANACAQCATDAKDSSTQKRSYDLARDLRCLRWADIILNDLFDEEEKDANKLGIIFKTCAQNNITQPWVSDVFGGLPNFICLDFVTEAVKEYHQQFCARVYKVVMQLLKHDMTKDKDDKNDKGTN